MLFLLVGLPGAGKTTLGERLARERGALVLSADEWMSRIVRDGWDAERRVAVQEVQMEIALHVARSGCDVVLDCGFFRRSERDACRARAAECGVPARTIYLEVARDELLRRLAARNADLPPHTFAVDEAHLDRCISWLEPPTAEELEVDG
jgi:predicted kinase